MNGTRECQSKRKNNQRGGTKLTQQLERDVDATHKCGKYYKKAHDYTVKSLRLVKSTPMYGELRKVAEKNRDYVFLAKVVGILVSAGLLYFLYTWLIQPRPNFTSDQLVDRLKTMSASDLPMSEAANVQAEVDALKCHREYFNKNPYSLESAGSYDLVRGTLVLPFIIFFLHYILPVGALVYTGWFIYHYIGYITRAIYGFITEVMIKYMVRFIVCKIANIIPFFSFGCPSLSGYLIAWRKKYIDEPVYREKVKYFRFYYLNRKKYYEKPKKKYIDQNWEKSRVRADYAGKFATRAKDVFYNQVLASQEQLESGGVYLKSQADRLKSKVTTESRQQSRDKQRRKWSWDKAEQRVEELYGIKGIVLSILLLIVAMGILMFVTYYNVTGKPCSFYDLIGPINRFQNLGNRLKELPGGYNWLAIGGIGLAFVTLLYFGL